MFNYFADVRVPDKPIVPSTPAPEPTVVEPDYTAINIAIAAMAVAVIVIVVFAILALKAGKKNNDNKSN